MEFTYKHRNDQQVLNDLYRIIFECAKSVPHGMVVFFSSYQYIESVIQYWKMSTKFDELFRLKPIFVEPRSSNSSQSQKASSQFNDYRNLSVNTATFPTNTTKSKPYLSDVNILCENVLSRYSKQATSSLSTSRGALLFSVMGGKLSEGINFSDDLARCVVVVGLPYPDYNDVILKEKLKFVENRDGKNAGKQLYEAMCLRLVNQSIGRSIRHAHDYSSIILIDKRYQQPHILSQLPSWISDSILSCGSTSEMTSQLRGFYRQFQSE